MCNGPQGNIYLGIDDRGLYETELQGMKDIKCNKKRINSAGLIKNKYTNINPQITDTPIICSFKSKAFYLKKFKLL